MLRVTNILLFGIRSARKILLSGNQVQTGWYSLRADSTDFFSERFSSNCLKRDQ